jgi:hypothetical protein
MTAPLKQKKLAINTPALAKEAVLGKYGFCGLCDVGILSGVVSDRR